jgi:hypothetical protein
MKSKIYNIRDTLHEIRDMDLLPSTPVENIRQISLFMQNKPNFPHFSLKNDDFTKKQTQFKPNQSQFLQRLKMNINTYDTKIYNNKTAAKRNKNKANSKPKQT